MIKIIETFKYFVECFEKKLDSSIEVKIDLWEKSYINKYPELEKKCKEDYEFSGYKWRDIAKSMVFNRTKDDFFKMKQANNNILLMMPSINENVQKIFGISLDINIVLYAGLCNSAGWVDYYEGKRAILFGLDKIAELNWHTVQKLAPLVSHELCHVIHFELRGEDNLPDLVEKNNYNIGVWRLYEEGFAQFYQNKFLLSENDCRGTEWAKKCIINKHELKKLYLSAMQEKGKGVQHFFGDWFEVLGISDTGYFLGAELIKELNKKYSAKFIAQLPFNRISEAVMKFLDEDSNIV